MDTAELSLTTGSGKKISVLGFGNILMRDDGFGPCVIKCLESSYDLDHALTVMDIGTPGLGIEQYLAGQDVVIIIDTVRASGNSGEVRIYELQEILKYAPGIRMGPHDPGLKEALLTLQFLGEAPKEVFLVGVIPSDVSTGIGLSPEVQSAVRTVESEVVEILCRQGVLVKKKDTYCVPDLWWQNRKNPVHLEN